MVVQDSTPLKSFHTASTGGGCISVASELPSERVSSDGRFFADAREELRQREVAGGHGAIVSQASTVKDGFNL